MRSKLIISVFVALTGGCLFAIGAIGAYAASNLPAKGDASREQRIFIAQASPSADLDRLKSRGAKIVGDSEIKGLVDRGRVEKGGIACVGVSQCLILIDNFGTQCKSFRCGNDHGTPVCWCDT